MINGASEVLPLRSRSRMFAPEYGVPLDPATEAQPDLVSLVQIWREWTKDGS
jgi:predicted PhzF superfamily epimerase YddE/YHI9